MVTVNLALPFAALSVGEAMELFQQLFKFGGRLKSVKTTGRNFWALQSFVRLQVIQKHRI